MDSEIKQVTPDPRRQADALVLAGLELAVTLLGAVIPCSDPQDQPDMAKLKERLVEAHRAKLASLV